MERQVNPVQPRARSQGFSLLETTVAAGVVFLLVTMAYIALPQAQRSSLAAADEMHANDLAMEMLRVIGRREFDDVAIGTWDGRIPTRAQGTGDAAFPPAPYPGSQRSFTEGGRERTVTYQVEVRCEAGRDRSGMAADDLKRLDVIVHWTGNDGTAEQVLVTTLAVRR